MSGMATEMAYQWLKSNGYIVHSDLYFIRSFSKSNTPVALELIFKNDSFEIYWAETKVEPVVKKVEKAPKLEVDYFESAPVEKKEYKFGKSKK